MARDLTALAGQEKAAAQIPVSLVRLEIPTYEKNMTDVDVPVYLNPVTNAVTGSGLVAFLPYAGLTVPQVQLDAESLAGELQISVSNVEGDWFTIMMANQFREKPATIWQGNLVFPAGNNNPNAVTLQGVIRQWSGRIESIEASLEYATITLSSLTNYFTMRFPYRNYSQTEFTHMPASGASLKWGYTEEEV